MHSNNLAQRQPSLHRTAADGLELNKLRQSTFKGHRTLADSRHAPESPQDQAAESFPAAIYVDHSGWRECVGQFA